MSNDFDTGTKYISEKKQFFNKCSWENWVSTYKRRKLEPYLSLYLKLTKN
jgi:hypothetical protein